MKNILLIIILFSCKCGDPKEPCPTGTTKFQDSGDCVSQKVVDYANCAKTHIAQKKQKEVGLIIDLGKKTGKIGKSENEEIKRQLCDTSTTDTVCLANLEHCRSASFPEPVKGNPSSDCKLSNYEVITKWVCTEIARDLHPSQVVRTISNGNTSSQIEAKFFFDGDQCANYAGRMQSEIFQIKPNGEKMQVFSDYTTTKALNGRHLEIKESKLEQNMITDVFGIFKYPDYPKSQFWLLYKINCSN